VFVELVNWHLLPALTPEHRSYIKFYYFIAVERIYNAN